MNRNSGHRVQGVRSVTGRIAGDETVVVPIERGAEDRDPVNKFNETGARLWGLFQRGRGVAELAAWLQAQYGLSAAEATADAIEFVAGLAEKGLIRRE